MQKRSAVRGPRLARQPSFLSEEKLLTTWRSREGFSDIQTLKDLIDIYPRMSGFQSASFVENVCQMLTDYATQFSSGQLNVFENSGLIVSVMHCLELNEPSVWNGCNHALGCAFSNLGDSGNWGVLLEKVATSLGTSLKHSYELELRCRQLEVLCQVMSTAPQDTLRQSEEFMDGLSAMIVKMHVQFRRTDPRILFYIEWAMNLIKDCPKIRDAETPFEMVKQGCLFASKYGVDLIEGAIGLFEDAIQLKPKSAWDRLKNLSEPLGELYGIYQGLKRDKWYSAYMGSAGCASTLSDCMASLERWYAPKVRGKGQHILCWQSHYANLMRAAHLVVHQQKLSEEDVQRAVRSLKTYSAMSIKHDKDDYKQYAYTVCTMFLKLCDSPLASIRNAAEKELSLFVREFNRLGLFKSLSTEINARLVLLKKEKTATKSSLPHPKKSRRTRRFSLPMLKPTWQVGTLLSISPTFHSFFKAGYVSELVRQSFEQLVLKFWSSNRQRQDGDMTESMTLEDRATPTRSRSGGGELNAIREMDSAISMESERSSSESGGIQRRSSRPSRQHSFSNSSAPEDAELTRRWLFHEGQVINDIVGALEDIAPGVFTQDEQGAMAEKIKTHPDFQSQKARFLQELSVVGHDDQTVPQKHYEALQKERRAIIELSNAAIGRASAAMSRSEFVSARQDFIMAAKLNPRIGFDFHRWADAALALGLPQEAEACLKHALSIHCVGDGRYYVLLGKSLFYQGESKINDAIEAIQTGINMQSDLAGDGYLEIATGLHVYAKNKAELGIAYYYCCKALDAKEAFKEASLLAAKISLDQFIEDPNSRVYERQANDAITRILQSEHHKEEAAFLMVRYLFHIIERMSCATSSERVVYKQRIDMAIKYAKLVLSQSPTHSEAMEYLGDFYRLKRDYKEAVKHYESAISHGNLDLTTLLSIGECYYELGQMEGGSYLHDAQVYFKMAVQQFPTSSTARLWSGIANWLSSPEVAKQSYIKAVELAEADKDLSNRYVALIALMVLQRLAAKKSKAIDGDIRTEMEARFDQIEQLFGEGLSKDTLYFLERAVFQKQLGDIDSALHTLSILDEQILPDHQACISKDEYEGVDWSIRTLLNQYPWVNISASILMYKLRVTLSIKKEGVSSNESWEHSLAQDYLTAYKEAVLREPSAVSYYLYATSCSQVYGLTGQLEHLHECSTYIRKAVQLDPEHMKGLLFHVADHHLDRYDKDPQGYHSREYDVKREEAEDRPYLQIAGCYWAAVEALRDTDMLTKADKEQIDAIRHRIDEARAGTPTMRPSTPVDEVADWADHEEHSLWHEVGAFMWTHTKKGAELAIQYGVCVGVLSVAMKLAGGRRSFSVV